MSLTLNSSISSLPPPQIVASDSNLSVGRLHVHIVFMIVKLKSGDKYASLHWVCLEHGLCSYSSVFFIIQLCKSIRPPPHKTPRYLVNVLHWLKWLRKLILGCFQGFTDHFRC
ncbi:hypothetical protein FKM82_015804 [Ascaphus truei]